ncbi:MAG: hypothetical protein WC467_03145 [Patescibacteria group bacterium]
MKKTLCLFLLLAAIAGSTFAQSTSGEWQLQNPFLPSLSLLMGFGNENFIIMTLDLANNSTGMSSGKCRIEGSQVTFTPTNGSPEAFTLTWLNRNKFSLANSEQTLIFAKYQSSEDNFLQNYNNRPKYYNSNEICHACKGTGICKVCAGTGEVHNKYNPLCPSCLGSGLCKFCDGTGKFIPK